ncbi:WD40 repeat domain-containing protein [Stieleria varia]|uniref:WD domain, G-beta repeat n=1 Tax=Stieleria varia TaxID=2528005 RepID=A0A5C6B734_9BACT|nr:PD40 domain-containing protein [Stieleria varia]TWU06294.1 WD domain, G-beta repeat [Stieleria varia]
MTPDTLKKVSDWRFGDILFCVATDQQNDRIWFGSSDFHVYELNTSEEKPQRVAFEGDGHESYVTGLVRVGKALVSCGYDRRLVWWDIESKRSTRRTVAHDKWIRCVVASPDQSRLITVADDMQCKVWDATSGEMLASFSDHSALTPHHYPSMLYVVAASPDGRWIATGDRIGHVAIWDASSFEKVGELETPIMYTWDPKARRHSTGGIRSLSFSPDSRRLAVGGVGKIGNIDHLDGPARLEVFQWSTGTQALEREDNKKKGLIEQIVWSPDGKWILTAGGDNNGFVTIYDAESGELSHQDGQDGHIHAVAFDHDFSNFYAASHHRVTRWTIS